MKAEEVGAWNFPSDLKDSDEVLCPECGEYSPLSDWAEGAVGCETCGEHDAIICPLCAERIDHVHSPKFKTRPKLTKE